MFFIITSEFKSEMNKICLLNGFTLYPKKTISEKQFACFFRKIERKNNPNICKIFGHILSFD